MRKATGLKAAGLQLLVSDLEGHPGVEHGGPQLGPHQVISQSEDLRSKLGRGVRGQHGGAAEACGPRRRVTQVYHLPFSTTVNTFLSGEYKLRRR